MTQAGTQCSRKQTSTYCTQHKKIVDKGNTSTDLEPWIALKLPAPAEGNGKRNIQKIRTKLRNGPRKTDTAGTIYVYCLESERKRNLNYWKIGRTSRELDVRLSEWKHEHDDPIVLEFSIQAERNVAFVERLIHLYLAYARMIRYPQTKGNGFHSVWFLDPDEVIEEGKDRIAKNKHIEWFCLPINEAIDLIKVLVVCLF